MKKTLVVGATGATGRLLLEQLLNRGHHVQVIVRSSERLPDSVRNHPNLAVHEASLLQLSDDDLAMLVASCDAVASCLGHNLSLKGMFGPPYRLVRDATRRLCRAIERQESDQKVRFVLMNTAGNQNRDLNEPISFGQKAVLALIRLLLPPHPDNEQASDVLRKEIGPVHEKIEWAVVRPDSLTNENEVTPYEAHPSPTRSAIFDPGKTSRINVAHFMAELMTGSEVWGKWKGQMPVLYNQELVPAA